MLGCGNVLPNMNIKDRHQIIKPLLGGRNIICVMLFAVSMMLSSLYFMDIRAEEAHRTNNIKLFIDSLIESHNLNKLSDSESTMLAREIKKSCDKYNLDPLLVISVITVESSFDKDALSPMGAKGLMQLMPQTAMHMSKQLGIRYKGGDSLYNIRFNVMMGTHYLAQLSSKYNNNMKLYLSAYNCGPDQVDRMLREKTPMPGIYYAKILKMYQKLSS